jgi:fibronectin type 3 domain-containing protein
MFIFYPIESGGTEFFAAYTFKKISDTRIILGLSQSQSGSFNIIRLDKKNLPPEAPANLVVSNSSGTISLSWDAVVATETFLVDGSTPVTQSEGAASSYKIQSKDAADGTYTDLATATTNSYTDTITSGTTRWYRVYAVNEYGTSKGSNVVSISYSE